MCARILTFPFIFPFAEYGSAAGVGAVKKREHAAARQAEQVHGRLTPCRRSSTSTSDIDREEREEDAQIRGRTPATPSLIVAAHSFASAEEAKRKERVDEIPPLPTRLPPP